MQRSLILFCILISLSTYGYAGSDKGDSLNSTEFHTRLSELLNRTDKSIKVVREQIVQSQAAPFLAELYLQLAQLLSQKSNTFYYIQMEKQKDKTLKEGDQKFLSPVILAQKEANDVYRRILKDFPASSKRGQVMFELALSLKAIDEIPEFIQVSSNLLHDYPASDGAMKVRLLLGQHYQDQKSYSQAINLFQQVVAVKSPYERNLAKYHLGLIALEQERFKESLNYLEQVVGDSSLEEQENPYDISLKSRSRKTDLKREALIDSIRAYTYVFTDRGDPIGYYSKLAPTEVHFQEVIEKLSIRYLSLKKYNFAIRLLRALSERMHEVERVLAIYQDILLKIPRNEKINIPVEEMRFILDKYIQWNSFFELNKAVMVKANSFLETQVRDLATSNHDIAKVDSNQDVKRNHLQKSRDFYLLYLGYFVTHPNAAKMATNLADVYYLLHEYPKCGEYYLRIFAAEFGAVKNKVPLLESAISCLEKGGEYSFYQNVRMRGLLIRAIQSYTDLVPSKRNDSRLLLAGLKAEYEQGFFPNVLEKLFKYMARFKGSKNSQVAGELILDYFNTRNEFGSLEYWTHRMIALKLPDPAFNQRLVQIRKTARARAIQEKVQKAGNYDDFAQGKSYLSAAESLAGGALANELLQQALSKSMAEHDFDTFIKVATVMANKESNPSKRAAIRRSIAHEYIRVTRYYDALRVFDEMSGDANLPSNERNQSMEESLQLLVTLRDLNRLEDRAKRVQWSNISDATKGRIREQVLDLLESNVQVASPLVRAILSFGLTEENWVSLFKAQYRLESSLKSRIIKEASSRCGSESKQLICRWVQMDQLELRKEKLFDTISDSPKNLHGIEIAAQGFTAYTSWLQSLEGGGDPLLEVALSLRNYEAYQYFGNYLNEVAGSNSGLRAVLIQKYKEALDSAKMYLERCRTLIDRNAHIRFADSFCRKGKVPELKEFLAQQDSDFPEAPSHDPAGSSFSQEQLAVFVKKDDASAFVKLALDYYQQQQLHHVAAAASLGSAQYKDRESDFRTLLGCSLSKMGLKREAQFHLKAGGPLDGLKSKCLAELRNGAAS